MTKNSPRAIAAIADSSQAKADAYAALVDLIITDPKFAALRENELDRLIRNYEEWEDDAENNRVRALDAGYIPE